jgi:hypothetical protein
MTAAKGMTLKLYRFYNWEISKHGQPFALCEECRKVQPIPEGCDLELIAEESLLPCARCARGSATSGHQQQKDLI